jgi:hypothetical protein
MKPVSWRREGSVLHADLIHAQLFILVVHDAISSHGFWSLRRRLMLPEPQPGMTQEEKPTVRAVRERKSRTLRMISE